MKHLALIVLPFLVGCAEQLALLTEGPHPKVLETSLDDKNSTLFDYKVQVKAKIKNVGKSGYVIVNYKVKQGEKEYSTSQRVYFGEQEEKVVTGAFDEVKMNGKNISSQVYTYGEKPASPGI